MVSVKEAVAKAIEFAQSILEPDRISELRLEEVEMAKANAEEVGSITLSIPGLPSPLYPLLGDRLREYKTFAVNSQPARVLYLKILQLANTTATGLSHESQR